MGREHAVRIETGQPLKGDPRQALAGSTIGFFIGFAAVALFGPTAARFQEAMQLSPIEVGLLVAVPALTGSLLRIPFAAWVDTTGGRRPFLVLLALAVVGMAGLSLVVNLLYPERLHPGLFPLLLALGALCGCGIAVFSVGIAQVSYWFGHGQQGRALALYAGIGNLAPGLFTLVLPIALVWLGLSGAYLLWLSLLVAGALAYALTGRNAWYFQLREQGLPPEEARRLAAAYGQELFPSASLIEGLRISARKWRTWVLVFMYFTTFGGFVALTAWLPIYWSSYYGLGAVAAGALTALYSIFTSVVRIFGGHMSDVLEKGGENTAILALLIMVNGAMLMTVTDKFEVAVPAILLMALGMGICNAAVFKIVPQEVPEAVGGAAGWVGGLGALGGFVIPPIMGFAVRQHGEMGYPLGFITFVVIGFFALSLVWILKYSHVGASVSNARRAAASAGDMGAWEPLGYRVIIDASRCWEYSSGENGPPCALCEKTCPEVFEKPSPDAVARVRRNAAVEPHLPEVRSASQACPAHAILMVEMAARELQSA